MDTKQSQPSKRIVAVPYQEPVMVEVYGDRIYISQDTEAEIDPTIVVCVGNLPGLIRTLSGIQGSQTCHA